MNTTAITPITIDWDAIAAEPVRRRAVADSATGLVEYSTWNPVRRVWELDYTVDTNPGALTADEWIAGLGL